MVFPAIVGKMLIGIEVIAKRNNSSSTKTRYAIVFGIEFDQRMGILYDYFPKACNTSYLVMM